MRRVGWGAAAALLLAACVNDSYEKGQGEYSLLQADFVTAFTSADKRVATVLTDDSVTLRLSSPVTTSWITVADTAYRAVLYYNKVGEGIAETVSLSRVPTLIPRPDSAFKEKKTDPVTLESTWLSKNGRYLNMAIYLKVGRTDEDTLTQTVGVMAEDTLVHQNGKRTLTLRFYHDQGRVPEYYSQKYYLSIPTDSLKADSIRLSINTYNGEAIRTQSVR